MMTTTDVFVRIPAFLLAAFIMVYFVPKTIITLMIILGWGHFILAYWYKFARLQPLVKSQIFWSWLVFSSLFVSYGLLGVFSYEFWLLVTAILFISHHIIDDMSLMGIERPWWQIFGVYAPVVFLYVSEVVQYFFQIDFSQLVNNTLAVFGLIVYLSILRLKFRETNNTFKAYMIVLMTMASLAILFSSYLNIVHLLTYVIFVHYILWYLAYDQKLRKYKSTDLAKFWSRVVMVNAVLVVVWYLHNYVVPIWGYDLFFTQMFFYIWTIMHILFSFIKVEPGFRLTRI